MNYISYGMYCANDAYRIVPHKTPSDGVKRRGLPWRGDVAIAATDQGWIARGANRANVVPTSIQQNARHMTQPVG